MALQSRDFGKRIVYRGCPSGDYKPRYDRAQDTALKQSGTVGSLSRVVYAGYISVEDKEACRMKQTKSKSKNMQSVVVIVLAILLVGVVIYFLFMNRQTDTGQQTESVQSESTKMDDVGAMMKLVRMEMPRAEVDTAIGSPYECTENTMVRCSYGSKNTTHHLSVSYMNGKVWGMSAVANTHQ